MEKEEYRLMFEMEKDHWWYRGLRHLIFSTLNKMSVGREMKILDAGCGIGRLSYAMAELGAEVISMDYNDIAVKIAQEYLKDNPRVSVIQGDILNPPLKPNSFDLILSWGVLHHTGDSKVAFDQLVPLVKNEGIFFVMLYEKYNVFKIWFTNQFRKVTLKWIKKSFINSAFL